ncbi:DNA alkylation repair protein [Rhodoferax sp.]|uniref:DNA alkylation repair protein n=1 Tax=Rhodoferax sp. TaxID=50421 RepID=UPI002727FF8C|nr:DNA alkylation repair protein [Rhodoferax sp.]MDO8320146.1 DNA alkylation repair protein [Rhodoferax sp.]
MAEPLKNQYGADIPRVIAAMISAVHPSFNSAGFVREALHGYDALELMSRGKKIARALRAYLPDDYGRAVAILLDSLDQPHGRDPDLSLASFLFLPHTQFVAEYGLAHFELSMCAQHALTQRFTAEFSIRPFLLHHPEATLAQLRVWTADPSAHVRRLVSEGTRPRLPWAPRLRQFQLDPSPVLALLERLKDDPELYVCRSVANNLNDIGKDHPELLTRTVQTWLQDAPAERAWIVRHALRSAVKRGESAALAVLGFGQNAQVLVEQVQISPARVAMGGTVTLVFGLRNPLSCAQTVLVDLAVHYVKASGQARAKVFKLKTLELAPGQTVSLSKKLSLVQMSTRTHYPGLHKVDVLLNGQARALGMFELVNASDRAGVAASDLVE